MNPLTITITITPTTAAQEFSTRPYGKGSGATHQAQICVEGNCVDLNSGEVRNIQTRLQESLHPLNITTTKFG